MKNVSILLVLMLATLGLSVLSSAYIRAPFFGPGISQDVYLGLFTLPDLLEVFIFGVWAIAVARLGRSVFAGSSASRFRFVATGFVVLQFLYSRGVFIPFNFQLEFLLRQLILAAIVSVGSWYGLRKRPAKTRDIEGIH